MNTLGLLFQWIISASIQASLLAVAVLLVQFALRDLISARGRYALWLPVLVVLVMPVLPQSHWSAENILKIHNHLPVLAQPSQMPKASIFSPDTSVTLSVSLGWHEALAIAWGAGVVLVFLCGLFSYLAAFRRFSVNAVSADQGLMAMIDSLCLELRMRRSPCVLISKSAESPAVTGLLRPVLLLPADFTTLFRDEEARLVLSHELMHLKRRDLQLNVLICLLQAMHWFNPVLWLVALRVMHDREAACDAQVLAFDQRDRRSDYGNALLKVQTAYCPRGLSLGLVGIFENHRALRSRIKAIGRYRQPRFWGDIVAVAAIILLGLLGATTVQTNQPESVMSLPENTNALITQEYSVPSGMFDISAGISIVQRLQAAGVQFPPGSCAKYISACHKLIVCNTKDNQGILAAVMAALPQESSEEAKLGKKLETNPDCEKIQNKLSHIIIPKFECWNKTVGEAIDVLRKTSVETDTTETDPAKRGVNIVFNLDTAKEALDRGTKINLTFKNLPLGEVFRYVADLGHLSMKVSPDSLVFSSTKTCTSYP